MNEDKPLVAVYDLEVSPNTFDFVSFFLMASMEMRERQFRRLVIAIVCNHDGGLRQGDTEAHRFSEWRFRHILVELLACMACDCSLLIFRERQEAMRYLNSPLADGRVFPSEYEESCPASRYTTPDHVKRLRERSWAPSLKATRESRHYVGSWLDSNAKGLKPVSISLRQSQHHWQRNSNIEEWQAVASWLLESGYYPFFLLDTENALEEVDAFSGFSIFGPASFNLELRMAVYEACYLNLMINNGPSLLCYNNPTTKYLYFKVRTESCAPTNLEYFLDFEFWPGSNWPISSEYQKFIWEDDRESVIRLAFEEMALRIEGESGTRPKELLSRISSALSEGLVRDALDLSAVGTAFYQDDLGLWEARRDVLMAAGRVREAFYLLKQPIFEGRLEDSESQKWILVLCQFSLYWKDGYMLEDCIRRILRLDLDAQSEFRRSALSFLDRRQRTNGREIKGGRGIAIFGAGEGGRRCLVSDRRRERVVAWIDNDESKWGGSFEGLPVVSLEEVEALSIGRIIVASQYCFDILIQLLEEGWPLDRLELAPLKVIQG